MKRVGFWRQSVEEESDLPHPQAMIDATWPLSERVRVASYLREGRVACAWLGYSFCRLDCGYPIQLMGTKDLTDGEWVWPEGFAHYVEHHAVRPPEEFLRSIASRLPALLPTWRLGAAYRDVMLRRRIAQARREAEAEARLPPHTTPLHEAAQAGDLAVLEAAPDVDLRDRLGQTPLYVAARAGRIEAVKLLLARGASVDAKTTSNITPLVEARGVEIATLLLEAGAAIEPEPIGYATPLTGACMRDDHAHVALLLDRGADVNRGDRHRTPLEASASSHGTSVVELLLARGADATKGCPLTGAARYGDVAVVKQLLAHGADPNVKDTRDQNALFHAAMSKEGDPVVELLLGAGTDPSAPNDLDDTALHMACARTSILAVKALLAAGARVDTKSKRGMTPLHWAAFAPERRDDAAAVLELLLAAGARGVDARDEWGRTPIDMATAKNDEAALAVLRRARS